MMYIKYDINKNNSIIDVSGEEFIDLLSNERQVEFEYDFPMGQKYFFYRWDEISMQVVVNDEETIKSFFEEIGALTGLDLQPFIENIIGGDALPNSSKEITVIGTNFSPFSEVEVSGDENFVDTIYFDSPQKLRVLINFGSEEGVFNLTVKNDELHSHESGYNTIKIKSKTIVDFRTESIENLGLEMTKGIEVEQDSTKGIRFHSRTSSWNRGVKISTYFWNRNDNCCFEIIFTKTSDVNFMVGIGSASLDVNRLSSAYYKQEIGMFNNNNKFASMYGGGDVTNWSQGIGKIIMIENNKFYKLKLTNSGSYGSRCAILEVDKDDWDNETELHSWISTCPADDLILVPFILPQASSGAYYITGIRY